jgi:DNA-binding transcriptional regulator YdaS (Cro superfamily)
MDNIRSHFKQHRGLKVRVARELGITHGAVSQWLAAGRGIPATRVLDVERVTGISRHELRPDIYPVQESAA